MISDCIHRNFREDGLHTSEPLGGTASIPLCWGRSLTGLSIRSEAILHQFRHQVLSYVHGVSLLLSNRILTSKADELLTDLML